MPLKTKALSEKLVHVARSKPLVVSEQTPVADVLRKMRAARSACALVCKAKKLVGIFTERDYLVKIAGDGKAAARPIKSFMTTGVVVADLDGTVGAAVKLMNARGLRNLPVVDAKGAPASVVTVGAIISHLASHYPASVVNRPSQPHLVAEESDGA